MPIYRGSYWLVDSADWSVDPEEDRFTLRSPHGDAEILIDTYDFVDTDCWRDMVARFEGRASAGSPVETAACGQFAGITSACADDGGLYRRDWLLSLADLALLVTLTCPSGSEVRHLRSVAPILSSLADNRA